MRTTAADLVVRVLEEEGVRLTFGIPGTHNIELYDALDRSNSITPVLVTDEQSASFMADGVARATGGVGVVNVVPGAGVSHALSGIAEAFMDGVPVVVLACGVRNDTGAAFQLHDIDQLALLRTVTKAAWRAERFEEVVPLLRRAFAVARAGPPGPVAVEIPANFYLLAHDVSEAVPSASPPAAALDRDAVAAAAHLLDEARRPALYVGLGALGAADLLVALADTLAAPVCTTISGKGVFPEDHPLFLWNGFGRSAPPFVSTVMERCDVLLAVGCRFGEVATGSYGLEPPSRVIHVDVAPEALDRNVKADLPVVADARAFVEALQPLLRRRARDFDLESAIAAGHTRVRETWSREASEERVTPAVLFATLQELAGSDAVYATDSGNGTFLAMEHLRLAAPRSFLAPVDYSCMGYSVPAAIGAKLAAADRDVVAVAGDGALLMTGLELLTAAAYRAGVVVCVLRDGELAQIAQFQRTTLSNAPCSQLHRYSTAAFAAAAECEFIAVADDASCRPALERAFTLARAGTPVVVEVAIDYSRKTYFTKGVVATNFWRLPWRDRLRLLARALGRRLAGASGVRAGS